MCALLRVIDAYGASDRDDAITAVSRLLGFNVTGQQLRDAIAPVIESAVGDRILVERDGKLTMGES
jgi:hypothetical protein